MVFLLAAMQDNQLLQFLYQHGVLLFDIIGGGQNVITGERAKVLGRTLMGLSEVTIEECCEHMLDLTQASLLTYDEFQLLYFELFKMMQLAGERQIDFEHFEMQQAANNKWNMDDLSDQQNTKGAGELLHTEQTLFEDQEGDAGAYQLTGSHHRQQ